MRGGGESRPKAHHGAVPSSRWESRTKNSSVRQTSPNTEVSFSFAPGTSVSFSVRPTGSLRTIQVLCQELPILSPTPIFRSPVARRSTADCCSATPSMPTQQLLERRRSRPHQCERATSLAAWCAAVKDSARAFASSISTRGLWLSKARNVGMPWASPSDTSSDPSPENTAAFHFLATAIYQVVYK